MDLTYTDRNRIELGVLQNYEVDFDTTNQKDFQIVVGMNNNVLQGGYWWYIEGSEYGGRVDKFEVLTESNKIKYTGRNFRGILTSKIIEPNAGEDYKIVSGNMQEVIGGLIADAHLQDLFIVDASDINISSHKINRYASLYDGICTIAKRYGVIPSLMVQDGKVHISFYHPTDYTDENEYTQDDLNFSITKTYSDVNHLICLGQGELKDRTVIHLYADKDGNVSEKQTIFGLDEVVDVYENTNAEDVAALKAEGIERLNELKNRDSFDVTVPDITLKIGDIIGGLERVTNTYVAREIVNIIARIDDNRVDVEYKVGEDDTKSSSISSSGSSGVGGGGGTVVNIKPATKTELGGIIVGDLLDVNESGKLSAQKQTDNNYSNKEKSKLAGVEENANNYSLPTMSASVKGGAKVGSNLAMRADGTLDATNNVFTRYSMEEQVIGTWIDGKPIYQKTLELTFHHPVSDWTTMYDCSDLNIDSFIKAEGCFHYPPNNIFMFDNYYTRLIFDKTTNCLKYYSAELGLANTYNCWVTIIYTKTTD